jgi:CHAD domain-containing protein
VLKRLQRQRQKTQQFILTIDSESDRFHRAIKQHLASLTRAAKSHEVLFGPYAQAALSTTADKFLALAKALTGRQHQGEKPDDPQSLRPSIDQLHQLRIAGKRLRYSIELFHSVFSQALRHEIYPQLQQLQDRLGALNDHDTAQSQFQRLVATMPPDDEAADLAHHIVKQRQETLAARSEFLQWWTPEWARELQDSLKEALKEPIDST